MNKFRFILNDEAFIKIRNKTIGASDIPIILGLSKFKTPYDLWREKTGRDLPFVGNNATTWGHRHEMNILSSYIEEVRDEQTAYEFELDYLNHRKNRSCVYSPATNFFPYTEFFHPELKWAMAHPDCIDMENKINIEAKSGRLFASMKRNGIDGFDPDDPKGYPLKYYLQVQWQMLCTGLEETVLRALIDTNTELSYNINANVKIQEKLIEIASKFKWHIKKDKEPMPINSNDIKKIFPTIEDKTYYAIGIKSEIATKLKNRKEFLTQKIKSFSDEKDDINNALFLLIGDNKYLYNENNEKICSQVLFKSEKIKGVKEIEKTDLNLYLDLKEKGFIYENQTRYVR